MLEVDHGGDPSWSPKMKGNGELFFSCPCRLFSLGCLIFGFACGGDTKSHIEPREPRHENAAALTSPEGQRSNGHQEEYLTDDLKKKTGLPTSNAAALGLTYLKAGDDVKATSSFESLLTADPENAEAHYYLGVLSEKKGEKEKAGLHYEAALHSNPSLSEASVNLSGLYIEKNELEKAKKLASDSLGYVKDNAALWANYGIALAGLGQVEKSKGAFDTAVKLSPQDAVLLLHYARWLVRWKEISKAEEILLQAKKVSLADAPMLASIAFELKNNGSFSECIQTLDVALEMKPLAELYTYRALCYMGQKKTEKAVIDLQTAVKRDPAYSPAYYYLGGRLAELKKRKEAILVYEKYINLAPHGPMVAQAKERLNKLKKMVSDSK